MVSARTNRNFNQKQVKKIPISEMVNETPMYLKHRVNSRKIERRGDCTYPIANVTEEAVIQRTRVFLLSKGTKVEMSQKSVFCQYKGLETTSKEDCDVKPHVRL